MDRKVTRQPPSRRDFLRAALAVGGLAAASSLLEACAGLEAGTPAQVSPPSPSAAPSPIPTSSPTAAAAPAPVDEAVRGRVAFVKTRDRAGGLRQALRLLGLNPVQGKQVFLKPNYNSEHPAPGSTHPDMLRAVVDELWTMGASSITVGDRSGMGTTGRVLEVLGVYGMAEELGFDVIDFDESPPEDWVAVQPPGSHWEEGFPFARPCLEAEAVVQVCCLKTHRFGGHFTMSLKNSVGMVARSVAGNGHDFMNELHGSPYQRLMIAEINAAYTPALVVLDGIQAFRSGGPEQGARVWGEVVLAGIDRVAIDAVGVALLRHFGTTRDVAEGPVFEQEQIARAVELGLGVDRPEEIDIVTDDPDSASYAAQIREILLGG